MLNVKIKLIFEEESKEAGFGEGYNFWYDKLVVMFVYVRMMEIKCIIDVFIYCDRI